MSTVQTANQRPLHDTVAVVTGGGRGIGRAIALAYAQAGAHVVLAARSIEHLHTTQAEVAALGGQVLSIATDVTQPDSVAALANQTLNHFGRVDVLVNNSGVGGPSGSLWELDLADWEATFAVNVTGVFLCCQAFLPAMIARRSGSIVLIGSVTGKRPLPGRTPYAASKLALVGLLRTLAWEIGPHGLRVNLISPGPVEGERIEWVIQKQAELQGVSLETARRAFTNDLPLGRLLRAEEIAATALFLASDQAAGITGEDINVAAGMAMY
ncbi:SDR family oxidoreductase [Candidatus Gracilibacteria bacterium]|nr:SDR family oxidoreductase [Candidatus Gracilibacteria bacterium]